MVGVRSMVVGGYEWSGGEGVGVRARVRSVRPEARGLVGRGSPPQTLGWCACSRWLPPRPPPFAATRNRRREATPGLNPGCTVSIWLSSSCRRSRQLQCRRSKPGRSTTHYWRRGMRSEPGGGNQRRGPQRKAYSARCHCASQGAPLGRAFLSAADFGDMPTLEKFCAVSRQTHR